MPNDSQNKFRLGNSTEITNDLKPMKIGGITSPIELSKTTVRLDGETTFYLGDSLQLYGSEGDNYLTSSSDLYLQSNRAMYLNSGGLQTTPVTINDFCEFHQEGSLQIHNDHAIVIGFKYLYDALNYFYIKVEDDGGTTLATTGTDPAIILSSPGSQVELSGSPVVLNSSSDIELNADGGNITFKDNTVTMLDVETTVIKSEIPLMIKESANAIADVASYGQIWVDNLAPNILMFTDDAGQDIHLVRNTAVWGGGFPRTTGHNGKWLGIPTGHQGGVLSFGTTITAPDTTLDPDSYADDLGAVIWQSFHSIRVTNCKIWYGQGGSTNTRHSVCLMRYDINASGDLSNGVEVAGVDNDGGSDDYDTLARTSLTMTSDVIVTTLQVLVAMVYLKDASNAAMSAKCILEYQDLP